MMRKKIIIIAAFALCLVLVASTVAFSVIRVKPEGYKSYMPELEYEDGSAFKAAQGGTIEGMSLVCEEFGLALYISEETTEIALLDQKSGEVWYSNPEGRQEDPIANPSEKSLLSSQFSISYYDAKLNLMSKENYAESVSRKQFKLELVKDGVRIFYTLGDFSKNIDFLPKFISSERLEELVLSKLSKSEASYISTRYFKSEQHPGYRERALTVENSTLVTNKMIGLFESAGYTYENRDEDDEAVGIKTPDTRAYFVIPLEYRLTAEGLSASLPVSKIEKPEAFEITSVQFMNFFGAGGKQDAGYIFVPNGSGSLINFNNGKTTAPEYIQPVYGFDPLGATRTGNEISEPVRMPVYGIKKNNAAFLAVIRDGNAFASVSANIGEKNNSFNTVGPIFNIKTSEKLSMMGVTGDRSELPVVETAGYDGRLTILYRFLSGDKADYSGMAEAYREMLVKEHDLKPLENEEPAFFLDIVGTVEQKKHILGVPYESTTALTTIAQAKEIVERLKTQGIKNIKLRYIGWFNGGVNHYSVNSFDISKMNGSLKELTELDELLRADGGQLYLDTALWRVYKNSTSHGYSSRKESSRYISGAEVLMSSYDPATLKMSSKAEDGAYYILSPAYLGSFLDKFLSQYSKTGLTGLSLRDLGDILPSDKDKSAPINREQSRIIAEHELERLTGQVQSTMVSGGNIYAAVYADAVVDVPLYSNQYLIIDEDIPFYQMALHGYVDYASEAQNGYSSGNTQDSLLKLAEYGFGLRYLWINGDNSMLKGTKLPYSDVNYEGSMPRSIEQYKQLSEAQNGLGGVAVQKHEILGPGLRKVTYQNGKTIYVNYNSQSKNADGHEIAAKSFYVSEERS